jgi:type III secretory pathway component EscS
VTRVEDRLVQALRAGAAQTGPSPDLFARVRRSVEDDRRRRRQRRRAAAVLACLLGALVSVVVGVTDVQAGRLLMQWWILELLITVVLIGIAVWLGPFIRRFGRSYAADVFRANPRTGKSFIVLADIAYYLIFTAYILFTVRFEPQRGWGEVVTASQLQYETARVGGILLIVGVLHGVNLLVLPAIGRLFTLNRRLDQDTPVPGDEDR